MTTRLAYLVTHPIQYQAPLLRRIAAEPDIDLTVFFGSDFSARKFTDPGFGRSIEWDVPLLDGYAHQVLPRIGAELGPDGIPDFWRPFSRGFSGMLEGFDALWVHGYNRACHWSAMVTAKRAGLRVLLRDEATQISAERSSAKQWLKGRFFQALDRLVDGYLAIGSLNRDYYLDLGIARRKIHLMPYAVDNSAFQARMRAASARREVLRAELALEPGRPIVLFAAKLIERKRPLDLLEAFARAGEDPSARRPYLLFAGDGPLQAALTARAATQPDVRLLGFRSQAELAALYDLCDVFVLPSERESWGLVVNEAMNAGRAIIVNDRIGAGADLVRGGVNGFVYPFGDVEALAICLRSVLRDPSRLAQMGARSRQIIDRWSFEEDVAGLKSALAAARRNRA